MINLKTIFVYVFFVFIVMNVQSQCDVTATADTQNICLGDCIQLESSGGCRDYLMDNDFNNGSPGTGWTSCLGGMYTNPCISSLDGSPYIWLGPATNLPRDMTTVPSYVCKK